jgi:hypothetical protein
MIGYCTEDDISDYADARGVVLTQPENVLLTKALDWLELQPFAGTKTDPDQWLEFPRNGSTTVPAKIRTAQLVCAMIYDAGGDPLQAIGPRVTNETVFGAVSVSYSDNGPLVTLYPHLTALLSEFLGDVNGGRLGGSQFVVSRG